MESREMKKNKKGRNKFKISCLVYQRKYEEKSNLMKITLKFIYFQILYTLYRREKEIDLVKDLRKFYWVQFFFSFQFYFLSIFSLSFRFVFPQTFQAMKNGVLNRSIMLAVWFYIREMLANFKSMKQYLG